MTTLKKKKTEEARKQKLYLVAGGVLLTFAWQQMAQFVEEQKITALRAPVHGNENTNAEISQLVSIQEMPLFAAMAPSDSDRADTINAAIFSSKTIAEPEPEPEPVEIPVVERPLKPQKPDYLQHFNEQFTVTATLFGGAVINQQYSPVGEPLSTKLSTPIGEREVRLMRVTQDLLTIMVDETLYNIKVR